MPGLDKTGPNGDGSKTGRQRGNCDDAMPRYSMGRGLGVGRGYGPCGCGMRRGYGGMGFGRDFERGLGAGNEPRFFAAGITEEDEKKILETRLKNMDKTKETIEKRIKELGGN